MQKRENKTRYRLPAIYMAGAVFPHTAFGLVSLSTEACTALTKFMCLFIICAAGNEFESCQMRLRAVERFILVRCVLGNIPWATSCCVGRQSHFHVWCIVYGESSLFSSARRKGSTVCLAVVFCTLYLILSCFCGVIFHLTILLLCSFYVAPSLFYQSAVSLFQVILICPASPLSTVTHHEWEIYLRPLFAILFPLLHAALPCAVLIPSSLPLRHVVLPWYARSSRLTQHDDTWCKGRYPSGTVCSPRTISNGLH